MATGMDEFDAIEREIQSFNFAYLQLLVRMIRVDRPAASVRFSVSFEMCRQLERMTVLEIAELSRSADLVMTIKSHPALNARLIALRQGADAEVSQLLDAAQSLWPAADPA